ncbi:unnamed protein product [marine sediment metagenome]|uniref:Uncharacterized protein n=1 Tax=marine sediment metagenome TaxID=412755 RepID=X1NTD0_9ZZZZ
MKKDISEILPAEIVKTEQAIEVAKKEANELFMKEFEEEARLVEWQRKSQAFVKSVKKSAALNEEIRSLYINYLDLRKKKNDAKLELKDITTGFSIEILRVIAKEAEREMAGEIRSNIPWPMLGHWPPKVG